MRRVEGESIVLRLKVTGACNRHCCFCHQEGGMSGLGDMLPTSRLVQGIETISRDLGIRKASITGGEPTLLPGLNELMYALRCDTPLDRFSLTTNGTIPMPYRYWESLRSNGLVRVNVSISDLLEYAECESPDGRWPEIPVARSRSIFESQLFNMRVLNKLEVPVDVNTVVFNDYQNTQNVFKRLVALRHEGVRFRIMLLPDLTSARTYQDSIAVIGRLCRDGGFKRVASRRRAWSSGGAIAYEANGLVIYVKSTMIDAVSGMRGHEPYILDSLCVGCPRYRAGECLEGFYGIRVEVRDGGPWVRLCLHRGNDPRTFMPLTEFLRSPVYTELREKAGLDESGAS